MFLAVYQNFKQKNEIFELKESVRDLKGKYSSLNFDNKNLNTDILILNKKISLYDNNNQKLDNINNWNVLFKKDIYNLYCDNEELCQYVYFNFQTFVTLTAFKLMQLDFLEHNVNISINKIIYGNNINIYSNNFNHSLINYEIKFFFNKIKFMYCDIEMNNLLYKKYNNSYPFYRPHYTPFKQLIPYESIPYSYSPEYTNIYHSQNLYSSLNYINRDITPF